MSTYKTEGIIIKRNNFLEASLILDIWTKDYGKVEAVARSARKIKGKLKGHLELFLWTELIFAKGKNIDTITSSLTIESFSNLRNNLEFSYGAYYILELVDKMTIEGHRDERVFCLLLDSLKKINNLNKINSTKATFRNVTFVELILFFQTNLLNLTGFSPELNKCVLCEKPIKSGNNYFSFSMGGIVGGECGLHSGSTALKGQWSQRIMFISDNAIKLLRLFQFRGGDLKKYNLHLNKCFEIIKKLKVDEKLVLDNIFLMNKFIEFNVEKKIKGVDFLRGVLGQKD